MANVETAKSAFEHAYLVKLPGVGINPRASYEVAVSTVKEWMDRASRSEAVRRKGRKERVGLRMAISLTKKIFPDPCECARSSSWSTFKSKQGMEDREVDPAFLTYVEKETRKYFREGWDRVVYNDAVLRFPLSRGACVEMSRKKGGMRAATNYDSYLHALESGEHGGLSDFKFSEVVSSGKLRSITIQPSSMATLGPLHRAIYSQISRYKWLLRGPPTPEKFKKAGFGFKSSLLSGDYKGATDSLDLRVSRTILGTILDRAREVPCSLKKQAMASLAISVSKGRESFEVLRGQMMGSFLSFPLLCLYNRISSTYALGKVPMLINGDDLVAETRNPERWFSLLPSLGLLPEKSKTDYKKGVCAINSTAFVIKGGKAYPTPTLRVGSLVPKADALPSSLGQLLHDFVQNGPSRKRAAEVWFRSQSKRVHHALACGAGLRCLGFWEEDLDLLKSAGVVTRAKKFARSYFQRSPPPPVSESQHQAGLVVVPERAVSSSLKLAMTYDRFFQGHQEKNDDHEKECTRDLSKAAWGALRRHRRDNGAVAPVRDKHKLLDVLARKFPSSNRYGSRYYGMYMKGTTFMAREFARVLPVLPVPQWAWNLVPQREKRDALALRWTQAG